MGLNVAALNPIVQWRFCFSNISVLTVFWVGLLLWNRVQGIWLIHSIPRFPPTPEEGYDYPPTGRRHGQTGICVTFKYNQYEAIGNTRVCFKKRAMLKKGFGNVLINVLLHLFLYSLTF